MTIVGILLKRYLLPDTNKGVTENNFKRELNETFIFTFLLCNCMKFFFIQHSYSYF